MLKSVLAAVVLMAGVAHAEVYMIDTKASVVDWKGIKKLGSSHHGKIQVKSGEITTDKKNVVTKGSVVIDMATITNEDLAGDADSQKKLVGHLSSNDFFDVKKYPTSTFTVKSVAPTANPNEFTVKGDLTMIGKTNELEFPATIKNEADGTMTANGAVKVDRTKWGLKYGSGNIFKELSADKIINDEFEMTLKLVAKKAPETKKEKK